MQTFPLQIFTVHDKQVFVLKTYRNVYDFWDDGAGLEVSFVSFAWMRWASWGFRFTFVFHFWKNSIEDKIENEIKEVPKK